MDIARRAAVWAGVSVAVAVGGCKKEEEEPPAEKVYRVGMPESPLFAEGNPTAEYNTFTWGLHGNLMLRTLVGYPHTVGAGGNVLVPDLATNLGELSEDRLTWTFHLKPGVRFGPPLDRAITSADVLYAFRRIDTASLSDGGYGFYYDGVIEGMDGPLESMPAAISGIETPDADTIVFHLVAPTWDFGYRLAMPAAAPVPEEVAGCVDGNAYGARLVASGPYMFLGADQVDASSCAGLEDPFAGYEEDGGLVLVRNPSYDASTDSTAYRETNIDRFEFQIVEEDDVFGMVEEGRLEGQFGAFTDAELIAHYQDTAELTDRLHVEDADVVRYITFNLVTPPFDDVHVRKAVNLIVNKAALQTLRGGPTTDPIATHVVPPSLTGGHPTALEYDPFATAGSAGDLEAAKAEMRLSAYDSDDDGLCDASACQDVLHVTRDFSPYTEMADALEQDLALIGIELATTAMDSQAGYDAINDPGAPVPISSVPAWGKDYPDPGTFMVPLFDGRLIGDCCNYALVGLTETQAADLDVPGNVVGVPSVDADIDACASIDDAEDRLACWVDVDKKLTEDIVPWVPLFWSNAVDIVGPAVTQYEFDQASGITAWAHLDVDPELQAEETAY